MAPLGRWWTHPLLWSAHERPWAAYISVPGGLALVSHLITSKPERSCSMGSNAAPHRSLAASGSHLSSLSPAPSQRCHLRQEPDAGKPLVRICGGAAAMLVGMLAGESPAGGTYPVATVVISGGGAGDQSVESPEVKVLVGWVKAWSAPTGGRANRQVAAKANRSEAAKLDPPTRIGGWGCWKRRDCPLKSKASISGEGTGYRQPLSFPRSRRTTCRERMPTKARNHSWVA